MNFQQRVLQIHCHGSALIGILDVPERPLQRGVLIVPSRGQYRVGSHRQSTLLSRLLAARGLAAMRFDCRGMGDSEGEMRSLAGMGDDIGAAIREMSLQLPAMREIVIWGLGDGATAAALYAHADPRVHGLVLLNPWIGQDPATSAAPIPELLAPFGEIGFWKKLGVRQPGPLDGGMSLPRRVAASLACFEGQLLVVLGGADAIGQDFSTLLDTLDSHCRRLTVASADHTFASCQWRDEVAETSANWILSW